MEKRNPPPPGGAKGLAGETAAHQSRGSLASILSTALLAASTDSVTLLDADGHLEFINDRGRALLELDPDQAILGRSWIGLWPEEAQSPAREALAKSRAGSNARFVAAGLTAKGRRNWWDVAVSPVRDDGGTIRHHLCVSRDITQQKRVEVSLNSSQRQFRALADNMAQLAWMADAKGDVFWFNKRWTEYTGTTLTDVSGEGWRQVQHPELVDQVMARITAAFRTGEMWEEVLPLRGADGSYRWFLSRAEPVMSDAGSGQLWCATHTDITDQRNLGQRVRQLARVIELSHEAMLIWGFESGIILWNKGCEELYGYRRSEALGAKSNELLASRHPVQRETFERQLIHDGEWSGEIRQRTKDGAEVWVESRLELIRAGGQNLVLETNRDITERRKADAMRDLLVAELDHRVKNTLAIVQSLAAQTARTQRDMPAFVASFTGRIQSLAAAQALLSDAHWSGARLYDLVKSQLAIAVDRSKQIRLSGDEVFLPPQTSLQLTLMLHELATNAQKHGTLSTDDGRLDVAWRVAAGTPRRVIIDWTESGGPRVSAPREPGFGRQLIERTGRFPFINSKLDFLPAGVHCRISAVLPEAASVPTDYFDPRQQTVVRTWETPRQQARRRQGRRVLVVESDPLDALHLEEALAEGGYFVVGPARSTEDAAKAIRTMRFDVVIADLGSIDGARVLAELEACDVPAILIEGPQSGPELASRSMVRGRLAKPLRSQAVLEMLSKLAV